MHEYREIRRKVVGRGPDSGRAGGARPRRRVPPRRPSRRPRSSRPPERSTESSPDPASPDPPPPSETPKPVSYVEGRGVVFRTPDNLFEASLGFNLQVRYSHIDLDAAANGIDADQFRVRRFKLFLSGFAFDPRLTWRFQAAFESTAAERILDDAWLNWKFSDAASVQFGAVQDAVRAPGALQRRRAAVPGAVVRDGRLQAEPGHRRDGRGVVPGKQPRVPGGSLRRRRPEHAPHQRPRDAGAAAGLESARARWATSEADVQGHDDLALSFGADGFINNLQKTGPGAFEALVLNYAGPAGWLGRNANLFTDGENVDSEVVGIRDAAQVEGPLGAGRILPRAGGG